MTRKPDMMLWLDDHRGVYIPRDFANSFVDASKHVFGVSKKDWETLKAGPDHECYWEAWQQVLDNCFIVDDKGVRYNVYQDGDCWLVPEGMEWNDDSGTFEWSDENAA